jgi:hypothetical protein
LLLFLGIVVQTLAVLALKVAVVVTNIVSNVNLVSLVKNALVQKMVTVVLLVVVKFLQTKVHVVVKLEVQKEVKVLQLMSMTKVPSQHWHKNIGINVIIEVCHKK